MKKLCNEKGYSLLLVFFVLMLISIAGISLLTVSANSLKTSSNERKDQSIYYIAEAGLNLKKAEVLSALEKAESEALKKVKELQNEVKYGDKVFADAQEAKEAYNRLYTTTLKTELKNLLLGGKEKVTTEYNTFEVSDYKSSPHSLVTIRLASRNDEGLVYNLESLGDIEGKTRKVITTIEITPKEIDITTGPPANSPGSGSNGGTNGTSTNPYKDSIFNKGGTNLVVTTKPTLNGDHFKNTAQPQVIGGYVLNVPKQKGEDFETTVNKAVSVIKDPVLRDLNKQYLIHKNACESNNFGSNTVYDSLSATKKKPLDITLTNNVVYIKEGISLDKSALTFNSASPVNIVVCGSLTGTNGNGSKLIGKPAKNINLFVMGGGDTQINNIALQTNFLFAPTANYVYGGNVDICSTLLVNSFTGNGGGGGGFTSGCSKPALIDPPVDTSPPIETDSPTYIPSNPPLTSTVTSEGIIEE